jgi:sugar phosphate isomerase/epimerase
MSANIGIQLYSLRNVDQSLPEILDRVSDAGFEGVEFAYRITESETDPEAVADALDDTGLEAAGAHVPIDRLEDEREAVLDLVDRFDCETFTVPSLDEEHFASVETVERASTRLDTLAADLDEDGYDLLYHNHDHEFGEIGGVTAFEALFREGGPHLRPQVDVGTALLGGADPADLIRRLDDVPQVHIKDVDTDAGESVPLGEGDVDMRDCADAAREADAEWLVYEYEGEDPLDSLDAAADGMADLR